MARKFTIAIVLIVLIGVAKGLVEQNVLGVASCSSGNLITSTNKVFQMTYPNETFQQLTNIELLKDVSQLKDLTCLQYLDATDRAITGDISNLKNLTNLEVFSLHSNPDVYGDICSLRNATNLRSLKFAFDPKITGDISCLSGLTGLETFAMTDTEISGDISVLANMPNLKALYINGTRIKGNICSLRDLTNLEELGIADEVGNRNITGDLACLDNLQKLKRVSLYNTRTTNCEHFTDTHPNIANMGQTESGKPAGGGCSKESQKTLINVNQKYERKIGKEVQTEVRGQPNYRRGFFDGQPNIFQRLVMWVFRLFGKTPPGAPGTSFQNDKVRSQTGPGGCKTQNECDEYCNKPENSEECSQFAPDQRR